MLELFISACGLLALLPLLVREKKKDPVLVVDFDRLTVSDEEGNVVRWPVGMGPIMRQATPLYNDVAYFAHCNSREIS